MKFLPSSKCTKEIYSSYLDEKLEGEYHGRLDLGLPLPQTLVDEMMKRDLITPRKPHVKKEPVSEGMSDLMNQLKNL